MQAAVRNIISFFLLTTGIVTIFSVVCITTPELPLGETSGQFLWIARGCIFFSICGLLSSILSLPSSSYKCLKFTEIVSWTLICLGGIQAVLGLLQIYGFVRSNHSLFSLTGSFLNPGPYSGYLAMILPIALYEWLRLSRKTNRSIAKYIGYYLSLIVMLLIICILPTGMSRSAWIASFVSCSFVLAIHYSWAGKLKKHWSKNRKRMIVLFGIIILAIILSIVILFFIKRDSADGRLFMWKITIMAILNKPSGYGNNSFSTTYGQMQEAYFSQGNYTKREELVAGSPEYPFNEYLHIVLEWGVFMLLIILLFIGLCLWIGVKKEKIAICGSIISLAIFAFSSYPFRLPIFTVVLLFLLSACITDGKPLQVILFSLFIGIIGVHLHGTNDYDECKQWARYHTLYKIGAYDAAKEGYETLYPILKNRVFFMFEYGHCLHKLEEYYKSNIILQETALLSCDPMILNIIGKNHQMTGDYYEAEKYFLRSVNMLPGRIYPYYLLTKLYAEPAFMQQEKMRKMASIILSKEPKVQSAAVEEMKKEITKILQD